MEHIFWDISFPTKTHHLESEAKIFEYYFNFLATATVLCTYVNERNIIGRFLPLPLGKWIPIHGKLYHFSQERITFAKAKATCEHNFGKLLEPKTETINNDIAVRARDLDTYQAL